VRSESQVKAFSPAKSWGIAILLLVVLVAADQATKEWVRESVPERYAAVLIPGLIDLTHVENPGVSFSVLGTVAASIRVPALVAITLIAIAVLGSYWIRRRTTMNRWMDAGMIFILAGAVGNLIDRFLQGTVTDFLHFRFGSYSFFVNNGADIFISAGVVCYAIGAYWPRRKAE